MNKKWVKRGVILGGFLVVVYLLAELFLLDYAAEKRYLKDKKAMIENFQKQEVNFDEIHKLSKRSPSFDLAISKTDSVLLFLNFGNGDFFENDHSIDTLRTIIDTFFNKQNWLIKTIDNDFFLTQNYGKKYLTQFEKIYQLTKQINCTHISNKKDIRLDINYKTILSNGFRYTSFYSSPSEKNHLDEYFIGKKISDNFYWNYFDESTICSPYSYWSIPESEFK